VKECHKEPGERFSAGTGRLPKWGALLFAQKQTRLYTGAKRRNRDPRLDQVNAPCPLGGRRAESLGAKENPLLG